MSTYISKMLATYYEQMIVGRTYRNECKLYGIIDLEYSTSVYGTQATKINLKPCPHWTI